MRLLLLAVLASAGAQPTAEPPLFEAQVRSVFRDARAAKDSGDWTVDEDADEDSFGIEGAVPLPNFGRVSPNLYRSGQPNREGLARLAALGVKTILVIRKKVGAEEKAEAERLGMRIETVPMTGIFSPSFGNLDRALEILTDPKHQPVLVHCRFGKDRTGVTVAAYRTTVEKMPIPEAAAEAASFGCCAPLFLPLKPYLERYRDHRVGP